MHYKILYEDRDIFVIHKNAGFAVQTVKVYEKDLVSELTGMASENNGGSPYIGLVHRLDQPVEGLLVVAKTAEAAAALTKQLRSGILGKRYKAVVCGRPEQEEGRLEEYIRRLPDGTAEITGRGPGTKTAVLGYRVISEFTVHPGLCAQDGVLTLLDINIETGRFHQIRAQLSHLGCPILGDVKYGGSRWNGRGIALCADELTFKHPSDGRDMHFLAEPAFAEIHGRPEAGVN